MKNTWIPVTLKDVVVVKWGVHNKMCQLPFDDLIVLASKKSKSDVKRLMIQGAVQIQIWQKYE